MGKENQLEGLTNNKSEVKEVEVSEMQSAQCRGKRLLSLDIIASYHYASTFDIREPLPLLLF